MKKLVVVGIMAGPLLILAAGLLMLTQPDVVSEQVYYSHSSTGGVLLVLLGGVLSVLAGMLAFVMVD